MNPCENWCYFLFCTKNFHFALFEVTIALFSKCVFSKLSTDGALASNVSEKRELYEYSADDGNAEQDISSLFFYGSN